MELLLLIELMSHRGPTRFTDADAPVSQIKERPQLLVYRYASRASGPQSDGKETHLFHRYPRAMLHMTCTIISSSACKRHACGPYIGDAQGCCCYFNECSVDGVHAEAAAAAAHISD